jgi:1-phosphofructokinase
MIYTITLNPAVDKTVIQDNFRIDEVNRIKDVREDAGGKGINVSKMIKNLKGESIALGLIAGRQGEFIKDQLDQLAIKNNFSFVEGNTRTNTKIVDLVNQTYTDLNEKGMPVSEETLNKLEAHIFGLAKDGDILVIAGSVPSGVGNDIYQKWIMKANQNNIKVILDADGALMKEGIKAGPYLIKPNIHELETLFNQKIDTIEGAVDCGKQLLTYGIKVVVISRGVEGSILITDSKVLYANALKVDVKSTVGAGDSMVGAFAYAFENDLSMTEALRLGVACSSASVQEEGTKMGEMETIEAFKKQVVITEGE